MADFKLGDRVQDKITGFKGIVIARTEWLHNCNRYYFQPEELDKDGQAVKPREFDEPDLKLLAKDPLKYKREYGAAMTGGPRPSPTRR